MKEELIQADKAIKKFKKLMKEVGEKQSAPPKEEEKTDYALEKQAYRQKKYAQDWLNFSVTVPPQCVDFLKSSLERYKVRSSSFVGKAGFFTDLTHYQ